MLIIVVFDIIFVADKGSTLDFLCSHLELVDHTFFHKLFGGRVG